MTLEHILHKDIRSFLEKHGIEKDSMSVKKDDLYIEVEDLEIAFDLRELVLDHHSCCLISHPSSKLPTLLIHSILNK
jgi:hypothetical protein